MNNELENIDDVAMRTLFVKEVRTHNTKLSYGEWFAMRLVNHHMGEDDAIIFMNEGSLTGKTADSKPAVEGSSPSPHAITQKERDTELKKTVLKGTKTQKSKNNTDKLKKSTVLDKTYGVSPVEAGLPDIELAQELMDKTITIKDCATPPATIMTATEVNEGMATACSVSKELLTPKPIELEASTDPKDITPDMFGLTPKQLQFCWEYIKDFNGARSVRDAGYNANGAKSQGNIASKMLENVGIQHCMAQLMKLRRDRVKRRPSASELAKSADLVLERVAEMANYDINNFTKIGKDGLPYYDFSDATPEQMRGMTGIKIKQGIQMDFEGDGEPNPIPFYDIEAKGNSLKATELLMRHHGLMVERLEIKDERDLSVKDVARRLAFLLEKAKREKK